MLLVCVSRGGSFERISRLGSGLRRYCRVVFPRCNIFHSRQIRSSSFAVVLGVRLLLLCIVRAGFFVDLRAWIRSGYFQYFNYPFVFYHPIKELHFISYIMITLKHWLDHFLQNLLNNYFYFLNYLNYFCQTFLLLLLQIYLIYCFINIVMTLFIFFIQIFLVILFSMKLPFLFKNNII